MPPVEHSTLWHDDDAIRIKRSVLSLSCNRCAAHNVVVMLQV